MVNYELLLCLLAILFLLVRLQNYRISHFPISSVAASLPGELAQQVLGMHRGFSERPLSLTQVRSLENGYLLDLYEEWGTRRLRNKDLVVLQLESSLPRFSLRPQQSAVLDASQTVLGDVTGEPVLFDEAFHKHYTVFASEPAQIKALLTPRVRAELLKVKGLALEVDGKALSVDVLTGVKPDKKRRAAEYVARVLTS